MGSKISAIFSIPAADWESEVNSEEAEAWESCCYFEFYLSSKTDIYLVFFVCVYIF